MEGVEETFQGEERAEWEGEGQSQKVGRMAAISSAKSYPTCQAFKPDMGLSLVYPSNSAGADSKSPIEQVGALLRVKE